MAAITGSAARFTGAQHRDLHQHNLSLVLHALRQRSATRSALAERTGLTLMTIGRLVSTLTGLGLVTPVEPEARRGPGRPAANLTLSGQIVSYGVEVTADDVTLAELGLAGESRLLRRERVPHAPSPEELVDTIATLVNAAAADASQAGRRVFGLGLALPALVNHEEQVVGVSASLGWHDVPLTRLVHERLSPRLPVTMESRAKCHALAQADRSTWGRRGTLVHLEVDLTIGAGVVVDGEPQRGSRGYAGNVGHVPLDPGGPTCACGNAGCLEALAGLGRLAELAGLDTTVPVAAAPPRDVLLDRVASRAAAGDSRTLAALQVVGHWLGVGCVNVLHTLDPDVISIGGYPPRLETWLLPHVTETITRMAQYDYAAAHELVMAPDYSGIARGAATLSLYDLLADPLKLARA